MVLIKFEEHIMGPTDEITIKVPPDLANAYQQATAAERHQMNSRIRAVLLSSIRSSEQALSNLRKTMESISAEATEKGLGDLQEKPYLVIPAGAGIQP
jgi:hypothetical protein